MNYTKIILMCLLLAFSFALSASEYDSTLAEELNADDDGMSRYVMVILKSGPNQGHSEAEAMELQRGHMENIRQLSERGYLVLAGPFIQEGDKRGIFLFDVDSKDKAKELVETDPAVESGRFSAEYYNWYGSAALRMVGDIHNRISKVQP